MRISKDSPEGLFRRLDKFHRHAMDAALASVGLAEMGQPMLLIILDRNGKNGVVPSQKELADQLHVSPATVTVSLRSLERQGYVTKLSDENDMRRKPIALTEKGREALEKLETVYEAIDRGMYAGFSDEERDIIAEYYRRMITNLEDWKKTIPEGNEEKV